MTACTAMLVRSMCCFPSSRTTKGYFLGHVGILKHLSLQAEKKKEYIIKQPQTFPAVPMHVSWDINQLPLDCAVSLLSESSHAVNAWRSDLTETLIMTCAFHVSHHSFQRNTNSTREHSRWYVVYLVLKPWWFSGQWIHSQGLLF